MMNKNLHLFFPTKKSPNLLETLFTWRNDPEVVALTFSRASVSWDEHVHWYERMCKAEQLILAQVDGKLMGQVRYQRTDEGHLEISILIAKEMRGKGWGKIILKEAVTAFQEKKKNLRGRSFYARIHRDNRASLALFRGCGFVELGEKELSPLCEGKIGEKVNSKEKWAFFKLVLE